MKTIAFATAALLLAGASAALAEEPAKTMDTSAGKIYTDSMGMTLYTFDKDSGGMSNCYDKCATAWPPLAAAADAMAEGEWTVVERTDGTKMWSYDGHPLYTYVEDKAPGDMTGEGKGGVWHVAKLGRYKPFGERKPDRGDRIRESPLQQRDLPSARAAYSSDCPAIALARSWYCSHSVPHSASTLANSALARSILPVST